MEVQYHMMGSRIRQRRKELSLKQSELAEMLDISNNHISSIENGRERPSLEILLRICDILKVTPDYLLLGNMHANEIPLDILESLRLCSQDDIDLVRKFIEILVERNSIIWNQNNFVKNL